ncbi:MAG: aminotransferase class V-fold PLP-dependent enzyme [Phycisphaerales bacterium]|nr:MAG: aminotransferase class V-fold PLP-dependent enzyme [Phycisphaerales bacterium]
MLYLDHASTSWPKPDCVHEAILRYLRDVGASPGRSAHRLSLEAERIRFDAREAVAELVGMKDPMRVVFTCNATTAINLVLRGLLTPGCHAITTGMEHNAVLRPLRTLEAKGIAVSIAGCRADGSMDAAAIEQHIRPETKLIVANHASNVCGTVLPVREIGELARRHGITFLVDAAQTVGAWPIDLHHDNIDLLAFTGHKALLGPTGTGGLAIDDDFAVTSLPALISGGTGSRSEEEIQPDMLPDKYEAGTPNIMGLAGLAASVRYLIEYGVDEIIEHERLLTRRLIDGLGDIAGVRVVGPGDAQRQTAVVSFTVDGLACSEIARALDENHEIMCRPGLHCAPRAHRTLGTYPDGTVRFAPGPFTQEEEIDLAIEAVSSIARRGIDG